MTAVHSLEKTGGPASNHWKPYPAYKPSGVEWIGQMPEHWTNHRIKHTTYVKGRIGWQGLRFDEFIDEGPYLVTGTDFLGGRVNWSSCYHISPERYREDPFIHLRNDDLLITKDGTIGKVAVVSDMPGPASLNSGVFVTRPVRPVYITAYMYWLLNSDVFTGFIESKKSGTTIAHLYQNVFVEFAYPTPTIREQRAIAEFLDRETGKIDRLLAKKWELIEKLKEERAALISRTVTRGLNPDAKLKPSGVEWLRNVPEHWNVKKLGYGARLQGGYAFASDRFDTEGVPVVRMNNLRRGLLDLSAAGCIEAKDCLSEFALEVGDLLWGMSGSVGPTGSLGNFARVRAEDLPAQLNQRVGRFRPQANGLCNDYLVYVIQTGLFYDQILLKTTGTAQFNVSAEQVESAQAPFPPPDEQRAIASHLARETGKIDRLAAKVEEAIARLQEYRAALITAAVTGKIDVREVAA